MKIGVVLPSRGLVFSKTMESVFNNTKGKDWQLYMAHDLPIPDCFNIPLKLSLKDGCKLIWFVEEDMYIPPDTLDKMLALFAAGEKVISSNYADRRTGKSFVELDNNGEVLYAGMGCLLVDAEILKKMAPDYLQTCVFWIKTGGGEKWLEPHPEIKNTGYGTQDIWLNWKIRELGYKIALVDSKIGHLQLVEKSPDNTNTGQHKIDVIYPK